MGHPDDYRRAEDEADSEAFAQLVAGAFAIAEKDARGWPAQLGLDNVRLLGKGGNAQAGLAFYRMGQWYGGRRVEAAGVAGVAVEPALRGRGVASRLLRSALEELAEEGVALSTLYPASVQLYARSGYALAGGRYEVRVPCGTLPRRAASHEIVRLSGTGDPSMRACYARVASQRNGWLDRSEPLWARVREQRGVVREGWAVLRGGTCVAYAWFSRGARAVLRTDLLCSDLVAVDRDAALSLLAFLASYSTVCEELCFYAGIADPLLGTFPELDWQARLIHPWMLRIVDAEAAIAQRGFAPTSSGRIGIEVADDLLARNRGPFTLEVDGGRGTWSRGGDAAVRLDVRGLAALYSGHHSAESLAFLGMARGDPDDLARLSGLFAGPPPSTPEMY